MDSLAVSSVLFTINASKAITMTGEARLNNQRWGEKRLYSLCHNLIGFCDLIFSSRYCREEWI